MGDARVKVAAAWLPQGRHDAHSVARFRMAIEEVLDEHMATCTTPGDCQGEASGAGWHRISVDYDPDTILCAAADRALINLRPDDLPRKTRMLLRPQQVTVKEGYGAPWLTIWGTPPPPEVDVDEAERVPGFTELRNRATRLTTRATEGELRAALQYLGIDQPGKVIQSFEPFTASIEER